MWTALLTCRPRQLLHRREGEAVSHAHVQALLASSMLSRNSAAGFNFAVPGAGHVIRAVTAARKVHV